jgi:hypothetical protein
MEADIQTIDTLDLERTLAGKFKKMTLDERVVALGKARILLENPQTNAEDHQVLEALATVRVLERPDSYLG